MFDPSKPLENLKVKELMGKVKVKNTQEMQNQLLKEVAASHFLIPVVMNGSPLPTQAGKVTLPENSEMIFPMLEDQDKRQFAMAFTCWEEVYKWKREEQPQAIVFSFQEYVSLILREGSTLGGFVINPFSDNLLFPRELIRMMKEQFIQKES